ncbi:MAG: Crp/Fnr family transcriptional regulator [Actinomycetota bacterium]
MRTDKATQALAETSLFQGMDETALGELAERVTTRTYRKGQLIFYEGDPANSLFIVLEGLIKVFVTSEEGESLLLATLRPPDVFGELALLDGQPRSASAEALRDTKLLELGRQPFLEVLSSNPGLTDGLLATIGGQMRRLTEQAADLVFLDLHGRVAKFLLSVSDERGLDVEGGTELDLDLTQSELASLVGGSRQSVNQVLKSFERRNYLTIDRRKVIIKDRESLSRRASR